MGVVTHPDQPITGSVLALFMETYRLNVDQLCDLLGAERLTITRLLGKPDLIKPTAALIVRNYDEHPELLPVYDIRKFYGLLGGEVRLRKRHFGVTLGVHGSAGSRYLDRGRPAGKDVIKLAQLIARLPNGLAEHDRVVMAEAIARGVNPWTSGSWSTPGSINPENPKGRRYNKRTPVKRGVRKGVPLKVRTEGR